MEQEPIIIASSVLDVPDFITKQIISKSQQNEITANCPDDTDRRFTNKEAMLQWGRETPTTIMSLMKGYDLAGMIFFRKKEHELSRYDTTFAIRMYHGYRGMGLASEFMRDSHDFFMRPIGDVFRNPTQGIWLETDRKNTGALELYKKFGYVAVGGRAERVIMQYDIST